MGGTGYWIYPNIDIQSDTAESWFYTLVKTMNDGLAVEDKEGKIIFVNDKLCDMVGRSPQEILGKPSSILIEPEDVSVYLEKTSKRSRVTSGRYELRLSAKSGQPLWVSVSVQSLFKEDQYTGNFAVLTDISELKTAASELHRTDELYRQIMANTPERIFITDLGGTLVYVNSAMAKALDSSPEKLIGTNIREYVDPEVVEENLKIYAQAIADQERKSLIGKVKVKDRWQYYEGSCIPLQQTPSQILVVVRNVTENVDREIKLKESEEKYRVIVESAKDVIAVLGPDGRVSFVNRVSAEALGLLPEQIIGENLRRLISPEEADTIMRILDRCFHAGRGVTKEITITLRGELRYIDAAFEPIRNADGTVVSVLAIGRDITEQKKQEAQLILSEQKYRSLVEHAEDVITIYDCLGRLVFANSAGIKNLGNDGANPVGKTLWDLFPSENADEYVGWFQEVVQSKRSIQKIQQVPVRGQLRWKAFTMSPLLDEKGNVYSIQCISKDIEELKAMEEELSSYHHRISVAERLAGLGTLMAMMSHEMNQPLTVIKLLLQESQEQIQQGTFTRLVLQKTIRDCLKELARIDSICKTYRAASRIRSTVTEDQVRIEEIVEKVSRIFQSQSRRQNVKIRIHPSVYETGPVRLPCDVEQMAFILISNALDASSPDRLNRIEIFSERKDRELTLRFSDTGCGIKPEDMEKIFEPFFTTKPEGRGTGLGLAILKRLLEDCGGRLNVKSRLGQGTTFTLTIPILRKTRKRAKKQKKKDDEYV
jgi:two-component system sporulation sensor kinase A